MLIFHYLAHTDTHTHTQAEEEACLLFHHLAALARCERVRQYCTCCVCGACASTSCHMSQDPRHHGTTHVTRSSSVLHVIVVWPHHHHVVTCVVCIIKAAKLWLEVLLETRHPRPSTCKHTQVLTRHLATTLCMVQVW